MSTCVSAFPCAPAAVSICGRRMSTSPGLSVTGWMMVSETPPAARASRMASAVGRCLKSAVTTVPPLKSMPRLNASVPPGVRCRARAEVSPASMMTTEMRMKTRRCFIQSTLTLLSI